GQDCARRSGPGCTLLFMWSRGVIRTSSPSSESLFPLFENPRTEMRPHRLMEIQCGVVCKEEVEEFSDREIARRNTDQIYSIRIFIINYY
ncbi:hypothetical protein PENTCL1PPCAC_16556, partial [Pristionchus entomophagus]